MSQAIEIIKKRRSVGNCILGYPQGELPPAKPRKENSVFWTE